MKIVQINASYSKGSIGRTTKELHDYLRTNGHVSYVFTKDVPSETDIHIRKIGFEIDYKIHALLSRILGLQGYFSTLPTLNMIHEIKSIQPDVVHLRNLHSNFLNVPLLLDYLAKENIPTVLTLHDLWFITGKCCHYARAKCDKWKTLCHDCPILKKDNPSLFFDRTRKCFLDKKIKFQKIKRLAVIGNSEWTTDQVRQSFLKDSLIVERIYNWIDMNTFKYRDPSIIKNRLGFIDGDFILLGAAQGWSDRKGLSIFELIAKKMPEVKIILLGTFNDNRDLPKNIYKVGFTSNTEELCEYYSMADVFINPSSEETFGKVSAEALCCGTPIIVNNATANPELVGPNCGFVVNNNNIKEYIRCISIIKQKGKQFFAKSCIAFARHSFDKLERIEDYLNVYRSLIRS